MKHECLAQIAGFARIERCGRCEDLHVSIGPMSFRINVASFEQLMNMGRDAQRRLRYQQQAGIESALLPDDPSLRN